MSGYVMLHRSITEWEWYTDRNTCFLFIHLLATANFKPSKFRGMTVEAGSRVTGLHALAEQTGLSVSQIRTSLKKLQSTGEIAIKTHTKFSIISITNWSKYQGNDKQIANKSQTNDKQIATSKEGNKGIRKEDISLDGLSVDHVADWLEKKRVGGKYLTVDEHALLEKFKNYCRAKNPKYKDYAAAFRNAFEWENVPTKQKSNNGLEKIREAMQ